MKKLLSCILVLMVFLGSCIMNTAALSTRIENIEDIPLDWTGWYEGLGARYGEKRLMNMHISSIEPDGNITGIISLSPHPDEEYGVDGSYIFSGSINFETGQVTTKIVQ